MQLKNWLLPNNITLLLSTTPTLLSWCCAFLLTAQINYAQINLVQNGSFEDTLICPFGGGQIQYALGWDTLIAGGGGSPDLLSKCSPFTVSVPLSNFGFQYPIRGNNYSGIGLYVSGSSFSREYLQGNFKKKLDSNKNYCVSFYINLANIATTAIDRIGAYLDEGGINSQYFQATINYTPQIQSPVGQYLTDTLNWTKIQGTYTANGTEQFITLGNFLSDVQTNTVSVTIGFVAAYYFIDDVSVIDTDTKAYAGNDKLICVGDSVFLGLNEQAIDATWYSNNNTIAQGAGTWVKPTVTQQYVIKQDVCGVLSYDTVQVTLKDTNLCNPTPTISTTNTAQQLTLPNIITPNNDGINDYFIIQNLLNNTSIIIYNRWGNELLNTTNYQNNFPLTDVSAGVYFYIIKTNDGNSYNGYLTVFR